MHRYGVFRLLRRGGSRGSCCTASAAAGSFGGQSCLQRRRLWPGIPHLVAWRTGKMCVSMCINTEIAATTAIAAVVAPAIKVATAPKNNNSHCDDRSYNKINRSKRSFGGSSRGGNSSRNNNNSSNSFKSKNSSKNASTSQECEFRCCRANHLSQLRDGVTRIIFPLGGSAGTRQASARKKLDKAWNSESLLRRSHIHPCTCLHTSLRPALRLQIACFREATTCQAPLRGLFVAPALCLQIAFFREATTCQAPRPLCGASPVSPDCIL